MYRIGKTFRADRVIWIWLKLELSAHLFTMCTISVLWQVTEYFQDYDPLRSGSITKAQFLRGLASLGLSKLGHHDLSEKQASMLCDFYSSPSQADKVLWTKFVDDVESGKSVKQKFKVINTVKICIQKHIKYVQWDLNWNKHFSDKKKIVKLDKKF